MIIDSLQEEKLRLEDLLKRANSDIGNAPEGALRITHTGGKARLRHRHSKEDRSGTYIPKDQLHIAKALAQKTYADKFIKTITPKLDMVLKLIDEYKSNPPESVYTGQNAVRQQLITPYILSNEALVNNWLATPYEPNPKHQESRTQITANGELVRSKSEVIIADNLKMMGIPYKYEAPVILPNSGKELRQGAYVTNTTIYPDFTCLNVKRRKLIYIEHFGLMDSPEYRDREFFWKLRRYESAGLIQGKNLLLTFEDEDHPFNFTNYKLAIEELLLK